MKKSMGWLVAVAVSAQVSAAEAPSIDRLVDCAAIGAAQERLACFDREVAPFARVRSAAAAPVPTPPQVAPPASKAPAVPAPPPATSTGTAAPPSAASFGEDSLASKSRKDSTQAPEALHAKIERLRPAGTGVFLVYLDNGQTWRHEDESNGSYLREGEAVTITKASLGTYRLTRDAGSSKNWIRVTRVR